MYFGLRMYKRTLDVSRVWTPVLEYGYYVTSRFMGFIRYLKFLRKFLKSSAFTLVMYSPFHCMGR